MDWYVYQQIAKKANKEEMNAMKNWVQRCHPTQLCPLCRVPATSKHIVWLCEWHHGQKHTAMRI